MMNRVQRGFTLIELMITVAIIALIAAIAVPGYNNHIVNTRRSIAKTTLEQAAQGLERCFTRFSAYNNAGCTTFNAVTGAGIDTEGGFYLVNGNVQAATFALSAVPQGVQATDDTKCATLSLDNAGVRGESGSGTVANCW